MVERYNTSLKKTIHAAIAEGKDPKKAVWKFTYAYRNTPHSTTGEKSSKLFFNRDINEKILAPTKKQTGPHHEKARRNIKSAKEKAKAYTDKRKHAKDTTLQEEDLVLLKQKSTTKKTPWNPDPYVVKKAIKATITVERDGEEVTRNARKWKKIRQRGAKTTTTTAAEATRQDTGTAQQGPGTRTRSRRKPATMPGHAHH